ncbi:MAG: D-alanine--D-alanine ligase [Candidatus Eremiobacteraeota bacterium]|nr:D-alanine--D-alanine ligase [Candidatus Eremiobacteraeota bacterium]
MGGTSVEAEISVQTGTGVLAALEALGYPATRIDHGPDFVSKLQAAQPAVVFNALHGGDGEDGTVQAVLEHLGLPYQGSGVRACAIAMDKWVSKAILRALDIPTPRGVRMTQTQALAADAMQRVGLPCVIKPRAQGSAVGVTIVRDAAAWPDAVRDATVGGDEILIEEYIEGREFTVAILEDHALPIVEITPHDAFYSYAAKYTPGGSTHTVPAQLPPAQIEQLQRAALAFHQALGARDYSRIDILLDRAGRMAVLECNTLPGLTRLSLFPDAARAAGLSYEGLVERLVLCALSRGRP